MSDEVEVKVVEVEQDKGFLTKFKDWLEESTTNKIIAAVVVFFTYTNFVGPNIEGYGICRGGETVISVPSFSATSIPIEGNQPGERLP